jgi:MoxR-like ATPase
MGQPRLEVAHAPLALTPRVLEVWEQLVRALRLQEPVKVEGATGNGKTAAVLALGEICRAQMVRAYMTPETESSFLVGQPCPTHDQGEGDSEGASPIAWQDGVVTEAVRSGAWALVDNLNDSDACVLERLNPLLEREPCWVLAENGETAPLPVHPTFRFIATMSVGGAAAGGVRRQELSPALANRFTSIVMPNLPESRESFLPEIRPIARALLGLEEERDEAAVAEACWALWEGLGPRGRLTAQLAKPLTFRSIVRVLDGTYRLRVEKPAADLSSCLMGALDSFVVGQFSRTTDAEVRTMAQSLRDIKEPGLPDQCFGRSR